MDWAIDCGEPLAAGAGLGDGLLAGLALADGAVALWTRAVSTAWCPVVWLSAANAVPADAAGTPDGPAVAVAAAATLSAPAAATTVSRFRFRVVIRRSRDKVTLRSIARP
jgi:hypothetical protein